VINEIYTIGYEGRILEEFIDLLINNGVEQVFDVRRHPLSRKKGFSKNSLKQKLYEEGIGYISFPELGAPSKARKMLKNNMISFRQFSEIYFEHLLNNLQTLHNLEEFATIKTSAIMCFEHNWKECHRSIIAKQIEYELDFEVINL